MRSTAYPLSALRPENYVARRIYKTTVAPSKELLTHPSNFTLILGYLPHFFLSNSHSFQTKSTSHSKAQQKCNSLLFSLPALSHLGEINPLKMMLRTIPISSADIFASAFADQHFDAYCVGDATVSLFQSLLILVFNVTNRLSG